MGSDRARVSYDKNQQYRTVVMQQGRVTVESDWNEAQDIVNEEIREQALDVVGLCGTPDDGYKVSKVSIQPLTTNFDFSVKAGTMYVGGVRAYLPADQASYYAQTDWLDKEGDLLWKDPQTNPGRELIYLYLREQEVSAVEDSALRDIALGGPDTAARTRLLQRIVRLGIDNTVTDCDTALALDGTWAKQWANQGLQFDRPTMRLLSQATLQVGFQKQSDTSNQKQSDTSNPCEPQAQGGYLGAENQLIRVQISVDGTGNYKLVWGFDNASFIYRVDVNSDLKTLRLQSQPVDASHQPRANQAVEVLRSAAQLGNNDYVASATGVISSTANYDPDTQTITLAALLPQEYLDQSATPRVFLRVWEEQSPELKSGIAVPLGTTGLQVTLNGPFHSGDYWLIAVRPGTPTQVYPQRYLDSPQPPEGPRLWVCPLALIAWEGNAPSVIHDCRKKFQPLTEPQHYNYIGTWLVLGPIFDPRHQVQGHSDNDQIDRDNLHHPWAKDIIKAIDQEQYQNYLNPEYITDTKNLDTAPKQGDIVTYGGDINTDDKKKFYFNIRKYAWRVMTFANMDWMNIHDIENNIHNHLSGDYCDDPYDPYDYLNFSGKHHVLAFFLMYINSPEKRETGLCVRSDDSIRVWLNGKEIGKLEWENERAIRDYKEYCAPVTLESGDNVLLCAVAETHVEWGFSARIENDQGLVFSTDRPNKLYAEIPPCRSDYQYISIIGSSNNWDDSWAFKVDIDRMLFSQGDHLWKGRVKIFDEEFKFFADGDSGKSWGSDGRGGYGNNFKLNTPGVYDIIFDDNKPINLNQDNLNPIFILVKPFKWNPVTG